MIDAHSPVGQKFRFTDEKRKELGEELIFWDYSGFCIDEDSSAWECENYYQKPDGKWFVQLKSPNGKHQLMLDESWVEVEDEN